MEVEQRWTEREQNPPDNQGGCRAMEIHYRHMCPEEWLEYHNHPL